MNDYFMIDDLGCDKTQQSKKNKRSILKGVSNGTTDTDTEYYKSYNVLTPSILKVSVALAHKAGTVKVKTPTDLVTVYQKLKNNGYVFFDDDILDEFRRLMKSLEKKNDDNSEDIKSCKDAIDTFRRTILIHQIQIENNKLQNYLISIIESTIKRRVLDSFNYYDSNAFKSTDEERDCSVASDECSRTSLFNGCGLRADKDECMEQCYRDRKCSYSKRHFSPYRTHDISKKRVNFEFGMFERPDNIEKSLTTLVDAQRRKIRISERVYFALKEAFGPVEYDVQNDSVRDFKRIDLKLDSINSVITCCGQVIDLTSLEGNVKTGDIINNCKAEQTIINDKPESKPESKPEDKSEDKPKDKPKDKPEDKPEDKPLDFADYFTQKPYMYYAYGVIIILVLFLILL